MTDADLARVHLPVLMQDRSDPFAPHAIGWTVYRRSGPSVSCRHMIQPLGDAVIEYAVYYDWDIGHLYDLEHIWVHLQDGRAIGIDASFHGERVAHPVLPRLYAEPGKHGFWSDPAMMQSQMGAALTKMCGAEAGVEGVHSGNPFAESGAYAATPLAHRLARRFLQARAFRPSFDFVETQAPLMPWEALKTLIPARVNALMADLPALVPHLQAVFLDCGDTLIDEATEVKRPGTEVVLSGQPIPGAAETVRALHAQGYALALVADGPRETFENLLKPLGLWELFDAHVISQEVGALKPDPAMFRAALEAMGNPDPACAVMVGNNLSRDILGANRAGITSVFMAWSKARSQIPATDEEVPLHTIASPADLCDLLDRIETGLPPRFPTRPGETVSAFALSALEARPFPGPVTRGSDRVDYQFINGFVAVGDLPCRIATRFEVAARQLAFPGDFPLVGVNLPGFNRRLDFSGFWHLPHRLTRLARCRLIPAVPGPHRFRLETCGGVHLWADGELVAAFEPYTRNSTQGTEITLDLPARGIDLVVRCEDMAERDTNFFVELTLLGPTAVASQVPTSADPATLPALMALARDIRPTRTAFLPSDAMELALSTPAPIEVEVTAKIHPSVHLAHLPPLFETRLTLPAGAARLSLGQGAVLAEGYHPLTLTFAVGELRLERQIGLARIDPPVPLAATLAARKRQALEHLAVQGEPRAGRLLARAALGLPFSAEDAAVLDDTLDAIDTRRDCADFVLVPLLWLLTDFPAFLPEDARARAAASVTGFRYWMTEPGNDTMWFWSENHVLCFHVAEYLAGRLFPDVIFPNAGLTGADHLDLARQRLGRWLASVAEHGLAEWNSAAYYPIDFIGLFALAHFAEPEISEPSRDLLDRLFTMIALHGLNGVAAGSMGRAYDKELRAGPLNELAPFLALATGQGWIGTGVAALPQFCLSAYAPPEGLAELAAPKAPLVARYVQGFGTAARLGLWKSADVQLSAAIDGVPGTHGHQQHMVDVQFTAPFARLWVNHPGEDDPWGSNRPSYWAGNGVMPRVGMAGDTVLMLFDLGAQPRLAFTHAYAPLSEFDEVRRGKDWLVLRQGRGTVIVKATGPIDTVGQGPGAGLEHRVQGARTGWLIKAGITDPDRAEGHARNLRLAIEGPRLVAGALCLDWRHGLFLNGRPQPFPTASSVPVITLYSELEHAL